MTVTFFITNSPTELVENAFFNIEEKEDSIFNPRTIRRDVYPSMNISNYNAGIILRLLNKYDENLCGRVDYKDLDKFNRDVLFLANTTDVEFETVQIRNMILIGRTNEQMKEYFIRLSELILFAKLKKESLAWV
jgi:hypothetical protein